ncbi:MAG: PLP-dependent aminotransferase family protein [Candidatus Latescibacteria bacterium]|nr:PLP-dependent aminotransferase family protein [Candidatus Latescibacterota bacterium]
MDQIFADRVTDVPRSFLREILKVALEPNMISFAGGLPSRELFPLEELKAATNKVFDTEGADALQYANSEGFLGLREWVAQRYRDQQGLDIDPEHVLITNGSQQGLDLIGKTLLNDGDDVVLEAPGYLGAIQAFSLYRAAFRSVRLNNDGIDIPQLAETLQAYDPKVYYAVPNFQNPSGITYEEENRHAVAKLIQDTRTFLVEDNPYGDLRFMGTSKTSFKKLIPDNTLLLGTFSKTVVPSFRIGWIVAPPLIFDKLLIAKQASDLHTNSFSQRVVHQYLMDNDLDGHIETIRKAYGQKRDAMIAAIRDRFPKGIEHTEPEGGMFVWLTLPEKLSAMTVFEAAIKEKVAFVPGHPFYVDRDDTSTFRLNFSCMDVETIEVGIQRLGKVLHDLLD